MLTLTDRGSIRSRSGVSRRGFLQAGALGSVGLSLPQWMTASASSALRGDSNDRSVIVIFNVGAPSQLDTFDPKPDAPAEVRGPFRPIRTRSPEIRISEILPRHLQLADRFSLVRTCMHKAAAVHDTGRQLMQTGRLATGGVESPNAGCAVGYLRGGKSGLPPHVVLPERMRPTGADLPQGQAAGFLGSGHDPFVCTAGSLWRPIGEARLDGRRPWRCVVEDALDDFERNAGAAATDSNVEAAYRRWPARPLGPRSTCVMSR